MARRVFIKVIGFPDEERHALNTLFRLSEQCLTMYQLWTPEAPQAPGLVLLDAQSWEARLEAESPLHAGQRIAWVGDHPPATAWRSFRRPLAWTEVIEALDTLFADAGVDIDLDAATQPDAAPPLDLDLDAAPAVDRVALIVSATRDERLYLRARLALARLTQADEAGSGAQALELARERQYDLALVGSGLPDMTALTLLRQLRQGRRPIAHVALTQVDRTLSERLRAWLGGAEAFLGNPPDPLRLKGWLERI